MKQGNDEMKQVPEELELKDQFKPNMFMWEGPIQSELELARVHTIELQKRVMVLSGVERLE